jgi:chromosome segregation ATPase
MEINLREIFGISESDTNKSNNSLLKAIKDNYQTNFDYVKFKQAVLQMEQLGQDESMAIQSAFSAARTLGIDKDILLSSINHYATAIKKERDKFAEAYGVQLEKKVNAKDKEQETALQQIADREAKIQKLQEEIVILKTKIDGLKVARDENFNKVEEAKTNFLSAYNHIQSIIDKDLSIVSEVL